MASVPRGVDSGAATYDAEFEDDPRGEGDVQVVAGLAGIMAVVALNQSASGDFDSSAAFTGATAAVGSDARLVAVQVSGGSIRWGTTTTTPTSSRGFLVADGGSFEIAVGSNATSLRAIKVSGDPILMFGWWK